MTTPPEMGIPMLPGSQEKHEDDRPLTIKDARWLLELASIRIHAELQAKAEMAAEAAESTGQARPQKPTKGLGSRTRLAILAGVAVTYDTLGSSAFPRDRLEMAKAIAAKASELQLVGPNAPLDPDSRPVREVAEEFVRGADLMRAREEQKGKPPEAAGNRRTRPIKVV
jgi:hypothetical protein